MPKKDTQGLMVNCEIILDWTCKNPEVVVFVRFLIHIMDASGSYIQAFPLPTIPDEDMSIQPTNYEKDTGK